MKTTNNAGDLMYINMDNGYAWIELKPASDIGNTFENGVIKVSQIKHESWTKFFSAPISIKTSQTTPGGQTGSEVEQISSCLSSQEMRQYMLDKTIVIYATNTNID